MVNAKYEVTPTSDHPEVLKTRDYGMFRSYICMILVSLIICLIFFLIAFFVTKENQVENGHRALQQVKREETTGKTHFISTPINTSASLNLLPNTTNMTISPPYQFTTDITSEPTSQSITTTLIHDYTSTSESGETSSDTEITIIPPDRFTTEITSERISQAIYHNLTTTSIYDYTSTTGSVETSSDIETTTNSSDRFATEITSESATQAIYHNLTTKSIYEYTSTTESIKTSSDTEIISNSAELYTTEITSEPTSQSIYDNLTTKSVFENNSTTESVETSSDTEMITSSSDRYATEITSEPTSQSIYDNRTTTSVYENNSTTENVETSSDIEMTTSSPDWYITEITSELTSQSTYGNLTTTSVYENTSTTESVETSSDTEMTTSSPDRYITEITSELTSRSIYDNLTTTSIYDNPSTTEMVKTTYFSGPMRLSKFDNVCENRSCHYAASRLLSFINKDVDPCENFYEFACGQRISIKSNDEMLEEYKQDVFKRSLDNIRSGTKDSGEKAFLEFYTSCLEHDPLLAASNLSKVYQIVKKNVGEFISDDIFDDVDYPGRNLSELISKMILLNHAPVFDVDFELDEHQKYIFKIMPPKFKVHSAISTKCKLKFDSQLRNSSMLNDAYAKCIRSGENSDVYVRNIDTILNVVNASVDIKVAHREELLKEIKSSFETYYTFFEELTPTVDLNYCEKVQGLVECTNRDKLLKTTIEGWIEEYNEENSQVKFDWKHIFEILVGENISSTTTVHVYFKKSFQDFFTTMNRMTKTSISLKQLHNLLIATFLYDVYIELFSPQIKESREHYCLEKTIQLNPEVASNLYVKHLNPEEITHFEKEMNNMFNMIKKTFKDSVFGSIGFNATTRDGISSILDDIQLEFYSKPITVKYDEHTCDTYLDCLLHTSKQFRIRKYTAWNRSFSESDYKWSHIAQVYDKNPVTVYQGYRIVIPYGMFYLYNKIANSLFYIKISTIGRHLAYHLANYFSPIGLTLLRQKYPHIIENFHDRLCEDDSSELFEYDLEILACINDQYYLQQKLDIKSKVVDFNIIIDFVIDQIVSDSSAIRLAYDTAQFQNKSLEIELPWINKKFTEKQMFYLSAVQDFCDEDDIFTFTNKLYLDGMTLPSQIRVKNSLISDPNFAKAFDCKIGTNYNPDGVCKVFPYLKNEPPKRELTPGGGTE